MSQKAEYTHLHPRNGSGVDASNRKELILCIRDNQRVGAPRVKPSRIKQHGAFFPYRLSVVLRRLSIERDVVTASNGVSETKDGDGRSYSVDVKWVP
jgi:hypothetical protein